MVKVEVEQASDAALIEAAFRIIVDEHRGTPAPGLYYTLYRTWLKEGLTPARGYLLRAQINCRAKSYLQARADALASVSYFAKDLQAESSDEPRGNAAVLHEIALAYMCLGEAHMAEKDHPDRDPLGAFKAFSKGTEFDHEHQQLRDMLHHASEELTTEQLDRAAWEVYNEGLLPGGVPLPQGVKLRGMRNKGRLRPGERVFRLECSLAFPEAIPSKLATGVRQALRQALATAAGVDAPDVTIEGVRPPRGPDRRFLQVLLHVGIGPAAVEGAKLAKALLDPARLPGILGLDVIAALGEPDAAQTQAEVTDITPAFVVGDGAADPLPRDGPTPADSQLAAPAAPKMEIELPYRMYRLVTAEGLPAERVDKHPFCMSRVYYSAAECPGDTWVEVADGSCRWRQTGSEVRVLALKVPTDLPPRDLDVQIAPFSLNVRNKRTGEVYLEGRLFRGVVPEDCFWTHCGGLGEDGCCITLHKMNLEVLQRHWMHSEMWWARLFKSHGDIEWDDYEKDYSDLPEEVLARHR